MPGTNRGVIFGIVAAHEGHAFAHDGALLDLVQSRIPLHVDQGLHHRSSTRLPLYSGYETRVMIPWIEAPIRRGGIFAIEFLWDAHDIAAADPAGLSYVARIREGTRYNSAGSPLGYRFHHFQGRLRVAVSLGAVQRSFPAIGLREQEVKDVIDKLTDYLERRGIGVPNVPTSRTPSPELYVLYDAVRVSIVRKTVGHAG